jgi:hypothetical protein
MTYLSDYNTLGFRINDIAVFLAEHGVKLSRKPLSPDSGPPVSVEFDRWEDWHKALAARPLLTLHEAASALVGIDPTAPGWPPDEVSAAISSWETTLERCVTAGELPRLTVPGVNGDDRLAIRPVDLAAWCARLPGDVAYPLPGPQPLPPSDPALREALTKAEGERDRLAGDLTALKEAHSIALLLERQQRQQAEEVAGDLAGDLATTRQELQGWQEAEAKAAKEWAALLAELKDIKARHVREQERLRAAAAEYEAQTDVLKRARAEMEQRQHEDDVDFSRLRNELDRLKGAHERLQQQQWERERDHARLLRELEAAHGELAKLRQGDAAPAAGGEAVRERGALVRHIPALQAQEEAILQELVRMGYDPMHLPERQPGKPGAKAATKRAIGKAGMWSRPTVFEKAWKRLRIDRRIAGGE